MRHKPLVGPRPVSPQREALPQRVCMHLLGTARTDGRVMREATALARAGFNVTIVDVEYDRSRPRKEALEGVHLHHLVMPSWFVPVRFKPWFLTKLLRIVVRGTLGMWREEADIYHAHDDRALPATYMIARLRRKPVIFDAHEIPIVEP